MRPRFKAIKAIFVAMIALSVLLVHPLGAFAYGCNTESHLFNKTTIDGVNRYPVGAEAGILNTTYSHTIDPVCGPTGGGVTAETDGVGFDWSPNHDWFEIGITKYWNYLASGYGQGFYEWGYFDMSTNPPTMHASHINCCQTPVTSQHLGLQVAYTGGNQYGWTAYWDATGTGTHYVAIIGKQMPSDRGAGWTESSGYGNSELSSGQDSLIWRCPCDGLWRSRAAHTYCEDDTTTYGSLQLAAGVYNQVRYGLATTAGCYP